MNTSVILSGRCLCGSVRFRVASEPLTVYACHCTDCQIATGSSYTLTMIVPLESLVVDAGSTEPFERPRAGANVKTIIRCPICLTALWGPSPKAPEIATLYVGTLDQAASVEPVGHLWTGSAQAWVSIPESPLNHEAQPKSMVPFFQAWQARGARGTDA